jgi:cytochrome c-type biogenesis protein CcmH/NrfF
MRPFVVAALSVTAVSFCIACTGDPNGDRTSTTGASREAVGIIRSTASPFCPGKTLDSCPSSKAAEWRQDVHDWTRAGVTPEEVRARLQARAPGFDLSVRPARWSGLIPLLALLLSTLLMWLVARRILRRRTAVLEPKRPQPKDCLDRQLDEEIARWAKSS